MVEIGQDGSQGRSRQGRGRRALCAAILLALLLPPAATVAQPAREMQRPSGPRDRAEGPPRDRREASRPERRDDQHRQYRERRERMSPDERRSLRRDLDEAGRDLYRR